MPTRRAGGNSDLYGRLPSRTQLEVAVGRRGALDGADESEFWYHLGEWVDAEEEVSLGALEAASEEIIAFLALADGDCAVPGSRRSAPVQTEGLAEWDRPGGE